MGKYSARKRSGPKKQSFKKRKYNKKMVGGNPDEATVVEKEEEEAAAAAAAAKKEEEKPAAEVKPVVVPEVVPEAAKKEEEKPEEEEKDAPVVEAENKEAEVEANKDLTEKLGNQYDNLSKEEKIEADTELKKQNIDPNNISPEDANKIAKELANEPGTPLWLKALAKSGAAGFAAKILNNRPELREKLLNKIGDIQLKQTQEKPKKKVENKKGDSSSNIKADWDTLIQALIAATDKESIENLLLAFSKKHNQ
jgi:hypothetical protein